MPQRVVVVGASLAGLRAAETLRTEGFAGRVTLIGAEPHLPYDRPPLSKHLLAGDWDEDRIHLRKQHEYADLDFDLRLGTAAVALDVAARAVTLTDGATLYAEGVIVATGATPKRLPGQPALAGVHVLRTVDDSLALRDELHPGAAVVVIGAGFIGLEVAATARKRGCDVTVLEGLPAPLVRALGPAMGTAVAAVHGRNGVELRCGVNVAGIEGDGRVAGVRLGGGELVPGDVVVVGVGVAPATAWLEGSGLELRDGVVCDPTLRAAPGVYAAGDLARWTNALYGEEMRIEHWTNAAEQGAAAAANLLRELRGDELEQYAPVPFFWSDQFDSRIQFLGRPHGDDEVRVVAGDPAGRFVALYGHAGRLRGVLGVSMPKQVMPLRKLLAARATWDDALSAAAQA
jgi:NADPH-dependent 2,4-dienoyl-CoA reductase/sulfur reductase-like enzyme